MDVELLMEVLVDTQYFAATPHHGHRRLDRLGHDFSELTSIRVLAFARHDGRLNGQQFAANLGPGQSRHLPDLIMLLCLAVAEAAHAEVLLHASRSYRDTSLAGLQQQCFDDLSADLRNFAFQITDSRFPRVMPDNVTHGCLGDH